MLHPLANLLTVPPNTAAFLSVLLVTTLSDRYKRRGIFMLGGATVAIVGYIMLIATSRPHVQYGGTFLVAAGSFACPPVVMGMFYPPSLLTLPMSLLLSTPVPFPLHSPFSYPPPPLSLHPLTYTPTNHPTNPLPRLARKQHLPSLRPRIRQRSTNRARQHRRLHRNIHIRIHRRTSLQNWACNQPRGSRSLFSRHYYHDGVLQVGERGAGKRRKRRTAT
jgi:hypothetical protein